MLGRPKTALFLGCAMAVSLAAANSQAQTAKGGQAATLGEIIVTAQRRSENVQSIPISVTALTGAQLEAKGAASAEDLTNLVPAVVFNPGVGGGQVTIRGIGGTNSGGDPGNAVYIDGVYQFSPQSNLFYFNAVDRIEVLKGPQGTLFGRNSAGGLVHVITRDPSTAKASGEMELGYANYNTVSGNLYFNAPITDNLAVNFAAFGFDQRNGWGRNFFTGNPTYLGYAWGVRGKAKWSAPDGKSDATLALYYNKDKPVGYGVGELPPGMLNFLGQPSLAPYNANSNLDPWRTDEQYTASLTLHHDFGFARFTSITAYDSVHAPVTVDGDFSPLPVLDVSLTESFHTVSQEFHLESEQGSRLQWIAGFLFLHDNNPGEFIFGFPPPPLGPGTVSEKVLITLKSYAAFGQATYAVTDDTKFTLGLRYTHDRSTIFAAPPPVSQVAEAGKPTWRLALDHKFTPDVLGYASYTRGFKSGLFNGTSPSRPAASPETVDAYEVGLKTESFEHRLRANIAAYYYKFNSVQVQLFDQTTATAFIANAGDAWSRGVDLDVAAEPIPNLTLTGGLALNETRFTRSDPAACYTVPQPPAPPIGSITGTCSLVGNQLAFAPKLTGAFSASYKVPSEVGDFVFSANYSHNSGFYSDPSNFFLTHTPAFNMLGLQAAWTSTTGRLNASVWGKNLLNEHVVNGYNVGAGVAGVAFGYPAAPLTFGGTVGYKF